MQNPVAWFAEIFRKKYLLYQLTKRDFVQKYVESYLGLAWAVLEPIATTLILSVIFTYGFKTAVLENTPFFLYMFIGIVAYGYFSMACGEGSHIVRSYSYLVKKVNFDLSVLPLIKVFSASIVHFIMLSILIVVLLVHGYQPTWYWFQIIYYYMAMNILILGLSWLLSSVSVFIPDLRHVVAITLQFLFYLSPVFWSVETLPAAYADILKLNPMYYIINGYRDSLINAKPFWDYPYETALFWSFSLCILAFGALTFRQLRPHFADVL